MARKQETQGDSFRDRVSDYLRDGEAAAQYMYGLADAMQVLSKDSESIVHHLRHHANNLDQGTLWVNHEYKDPSIERR